MPPLRAIPKALAVGLLSSLNLIYLSTDLPGLQIQPEAASFPNHRQLSSVPSLERIPRETFPNQKQLSSGKFCVPWTVNVDEWWTHAPEWDVAFEHDEGQCFKKVDDQRTRFLRRVHDTLWRGNCSNVHTRAMWSSGWGADFDNVADGLLYAYENSVPFQVSFNDVDDKWWHYAAVKKDGSNPTCPSKDMFCYFLPLSKCKPGRIDKDPPRSKLSDSDKRHIKWMRAYATRPQQWLRRQVHAYLRNKAPPVPTPCVAMHVRRADVVLHGETSRRYFPLSDYLKKVPDLATGRIHNILLFTDDANAIDEAHEFHPKHNWIYLNRTRHRGAEGGWENQTPSKNPALEVVMMHAIWELAKKCDSFVHTSSGFAEVIHDAMLSTGRSIKRWTVDQGKQVFDESHASSPEMLQNFLNKKRKLNAKRKNKKKHHRHHHHKNAH